MPIDPNIALSYKPTNLGVQSPMESMGRLMKFREAAGQEALRQAQVAHYQSLAQQAKLAEDQKRAEMADQEALKQIQGDPESYKKLMGGDFTPLHGKVRPDTLFKIQKQVDDFHHAQSVRAEDDLKAHNAGLGQLVQAAEGLKELGDLDEINAQLPNVIDNLSRAGAFKAAQVDPTKVPQYLGDLKELDTWLASVGGLMAANDAGLKRKGAKLAAEKTEAEIGATKALEAQRLRPTGGETPHTVTTEAGIMQFNPQTQRFDIPVGKAPAKSVGASAEQQFVDEYRAKKPGASIAEAQRAYKLNEHIPSETAGLAALDRETARFAKPHEKSLADATSQIEKISDARAMVNSGAVGQALGLPKVLSGLVGGAGSGLRMTKAELDSIANARGVTGTLEGWFNALSGEGKLSTSQKQQLNQILDDVQARIEHKREIANEALDKINSAKSRDEIVKVDKITRQRLTDLETPLPSTRPIVQRSPSTGAYRYSLDGGKTWQAGQPPK